MADAGQEEFEIWAENACQPFLETGIRLNENSSAKLQLIQTFQKCLMMKSCVAIPKSLQQVIMKTPLIEVFHWLPSDCLDIQFLAVESKPDSLNAYNGSYLYAFSIQPYLPLPPYIEEFFLSSMDKPLIRNDILSSILNCLVLWSDYFQVPRVNTVKSKTRWMLNLLGRLISEPEVPSNCLFIVSSKLKSLDSSSIMDMAEFKELKNKLSIAFERKDPEYHHAATEAIKTNYKTIRLQLEKNVEFEEDFDLSEMPDVVAMMDKVYTQIDHSGDRLLMKTESEKIYQDEIFVGHYQGIFVITPTHIVWFLDGKRKVGIKLPVISLHHVHVNNINFPQKKFIQSAGESTNYNKDQFNLRRVKSGTNGEDILGDAQLNMKNKKKTSKMSISLYFRERTFRFYPFSVDEIRVLTDRIGYVSGIQPMSSSVLIRSLLMEKVEATRQAALQTLLKEENPWIENPRQLDKVVVNLTGEHRPQRIEDMERLYHSCRLEKEVTKECLLYLKKYWYNTQAESVKLKVLSVLDRLIDPVVMRFGDNAFDTCYKWLVHLDESLNPYKSPEALQLVNFMLSKAKAIQMDVLTPIIINQVSSTFDDWDAYVFMQRLMNTKTSI